MIYLVSIIMWVRWESKFGLLDASAVTCLNFIAMLCSPSINCEYFWCDFRNCTLSCMLLSFINLTHDCLHFEIFINFHISSSHNFRLLTTVIPAPTAMFQKSTKPKIPQQTMQQQNLSLWVILLCFSFFQIFIFCWMPIWNKASHIGLLMIVFDGVVHIPLKSKIWSWSAYNEINKHIYPWCPLCISEGLSSLQSQMTTRTMNST